MDFRIRLLGISLAGGVACLAACQQTGGPINWSPDPADGRDAGDLPSRADTTSNGNPDPCSADGAACQRDAAGDAASDVADASADADDGGVDAAIF